MSEAFENVIGGGLKLKGGVSLRKPPKRKKHHKHKKLEKKSKKDKKKKEKRSKKKERRVKFQTGDVDDEPAAAAAAAASTELVVAGDDLDEGGGGGGGGDAGKKEPYDPLKDPSLTEAQRRHLQAQRERYGRLADETFKMTHRQRIEKFNNMLANLSEHHDVPKVGNAGMG